MKKAYLAPAFALILGGFAALLRREMLATAFDPFTGLMNRGETSVMLLCVLTGVMVLFATVFARCVKGGYAPADTFRKGYKNNCVVVMAVSALAGLAVTAGGVLGWLGDEYRGVTETVLYCLEAVSGICIVALSVNAYTGRENIFVGISNIAPCLYFVARLALCYRDHAAVPAVLRYCFTLMALAAACVSFYYAAGYHYGRAKVFGTVASHLLGVYFCCMLLGEETTLPGMLVAAGTLIYLFFTAAAALRNLKRVKNDSISVK